MVDSFGPLSNDDLQARVYNFQNELAKDGSTGFVVLRGPGMATYFNQRRILGCNRFLKMPADNFRYKFDTDQGEVEVEFWKIPKGFKLADFSTNAPTYKLALTRALEMTVSMASDDFCPRYFELNWYAKFLIANPTLNGRAVIDVPTDREFARRVVRYRKELLSYGVAANRIQYYRRHFHGERDEQWWLIPPKRK